MQFDKDVNSKFSNLFLKVRDLILSYDGTTENKKEKITTYSYDGSSLCHLRTMPHGVDIGFLKGILMEDKYDLLHGSGKRIRVLSIESYKVEQLKYYLGEAISKN